LATGVLIGWEWPQREAHIFIRFTAERYRPDSRPNHVYIINYKTSAGSWEPLFDKKGKPLYPLPMAELDAMKALRPTGGLMLHRDGSRRYPAIRICRSKRATTVTSGISPGARKKRFSSEIHLRSTGHAKYADFSLGFMTKKRDS
jgi:hypothetical protein